MSSSNCCFLTYIRISQEAGQVVWYSHLFQNFPQFIVIHTVKGFGIVNKVEIDIFLVMYIHRISASWITQTLSSFSKMLTLISSTLLNGAATFRPSMKDISPSRRLKSLYL